MNYTVTNESLIAAHVSGVPPSEPADTYRWYLCIETNIGMNWACKETTKDGALSYTGDSRSIAVPIPSWHPRFVDRSVLKAAVQPKVRIVHEFKKTDQ